jgi:hypothetical protein
VQDGCYRIVDVGVTVGEEGDQDIDLRTCISPSPVEISCSSCCDFRIMPERQRFYTD